MLKLALVIIGIFLGIYVASELHYVATSDNFYEKFPELHNDFSEIASNITCKFDNEKINYRNDLSGSYAAVFDHSTEPFFTSDEFPDRNFYLVLKDESNSKKRYGGQYDNFVQHRLQSGIEAYIVTGTYECKEYGRKIDGKHKKAFLFLLKTGVAP